MKIITVAVVMTMLSGPPALAASFAPVPVIDPSIPACVKPFGDLTLSPTARSTEDAAALAFNPKTGPGYLSLDMKASISAEDRIAFEKNMNAVMDRLFDGHDLEYGADYHQLNITDTITSGAGFPKAVPPEKIKSLQTELAPITRTLIELMEGFYRGMPASERKYLKLDSVTLRRYTADAVEEAVPHFDSGVATLTFSPNGKGTVMVIDGKTIPTSAWNLVGISNSERWGGTPTAHGSPDSQEGRLFVRIMFGYSKAGETTIADLKAMLAKVGLVAE